MYDHPEWLHSLISFMSEGVTATHAQAEKAGDWGRSSGMNQAMPYAEELAPPKANERGVKRFELWGYMAAQEFTLISPEMHDEFLLRYQVPILEQFGLSAYGCCEDLSRKIGILRKIRNLRRIAVAPLADIERCSEAIGLDYVMSYRPNPAEMVSCGFREDRIRTMIARALEVFNGQYFDITLKDVHTCEHDPQRLKRWVQIVREEIDRHDP